MIPATSTQPRARRDIRPEVIVARILFLLGNLCLAGMILALFLFARIWGPIKLDTLMVAGTVPFYLISAVISSFFKLRPLAQWCAIGFHLTLTAAFCAWSISIQLGDNWSDKTPGQLVTFVFYSLLYAAFWWISTHERKSERPAETRL